MIKCNTYHVTHNMVEKNGKKTILYLITQPETGGAQRYIFDLAAKLRNEFNISVAFGLPRFAGEVGGQVEPSELANELKNKGIEIYTIPHLKREISPLNDLLAIIEIIKLIKKTKPDIIHLNSSKVSILGSIAAKICYVLRVTCYVIYTAHGWVFNEPLPKWKKSFYFFAEKFTSLFKDKIICINKLDYEIAKNKLKINEKKLSLIYHGIRPINFLSREEAKKKLSQIINNNLPLAKGENKRGWRGATPPHPTPLLSKEREIFIGTIGNLYKTKGYEYFIEAVKILANMLRVTCYVLRVVIIGEGEERKNLENLIKKYNLEKNIILAGSIKNAAELLPAFDIYVCSSVKEGFPYSILEAMSARLPITASRVGGIPEMINDKINGILAKPTDQKDIAKKIKILIDDEKLRNTLSQQAQKDIKEKFGIEKMIEKTKEIYFNFSNR